MAKLGKAGRWIGIGAIALGLLLATMLVFEFIDGKLYGSKSEGMTLEAHPILFYVSTVIQAFVVVILLFSGISLIRQK